MAVAAMKLHLRRGDTTLMSIEMTGGCEPVFVGRSHDCALRVPADEHSVSGTHARLFWDGSKLFIEDAGSRNGIFHDGVQVVKPRRMNYGDIFALGNCQIMVGEREHRRKASAQKYHRLEFLNGDRIGQTVDIVAKPGSDAFAIGLDPGCDVNLPDMLVSRHHAYLKVRESGECWIEDVGSRNGTFVNGEKLGVKERLLKHGDKISVAYFDFRFLDRSYSVTRVHAWVKLAAVAVTLCVLAAVYVFMDVLRPSFEDYKDTVRLYAAAEDFASARKALELAAKATGGAEANEIQVKDLSDKLAKWEKVCGLWTQVREDVVAGTPGHLERARQTTGQILEESLDNWAWNPQRMGGVRQEVEYMNRALRLYFDGNDAISAAGGSANPESDVVVRKATETVGNFLREQEQKKTAPMSVKPVIVKLRELQRRLEVIKKGFDVVDSSMSRISAENPDFKAVAAEFEKIAADEKLPPAVREYARQQLGPCQGFLSVQKFIDGEIELLAALDFNGVARLEKDIKLPDLEFCTRQPKYSDARAMYLARHEAIQRQAAAIRLIVDGLRESGVTPDSRGAAVESFVTAANWKKALTFDCLKKRPPSARRNEPSSYYDEMLGIEFTYESLRAMPNVYSGRGMRMVGFTPKCITARKAFEKAETFVQYMDGKDRKHLQKGELGRFYTMCVKIAISREEMVSVLKEIKGTKRQKLVASFFAEYFTARPTYSAKQAIASQFAALKREVMELGDEYSNATDPERQILLRNKILEAGLPGDPVLHTKWVQVFN